MIPRTLDRYMLRLRLKIFVVKDGFEAFLDRLLSVISRRVEWTAPLHHQVGRSQVAIGFGNPPFRQFSRAVHTALCLL